jgi:hypothetical protein
MATPSAARVFTGESGGNGTGQGAAAILPDNNMLPYFMQLQQEARKERLAEQKAREDRKKDWLALQKQMKFEPVWKHADEELQNDFIGATDEMIKLQMEGYDAGDVYGPAGSAYQKRYSDLQRKRGMAEEAKAIFKEKRKQYEDNPQAYDDQVYTKWVEGFKGKPIEQLWEHANSENPLVPVVTDMDVLKDYIPEYYASKDEKGLRVEESKEIRKQDMDAILSGGLSSDPKVIAHYKRGLAKGQWKNEEEYLEYMHEKAASKKPGMNSTTFERPPATAKDSGAFNFNYGTGLGSNNKVSVAAESRGDQGLTQGALNYATVKRTGTNDDMPFIEVSTWGSKIPGKETENQLVNFQPIEFVLGGDGKIGVKGKMSMPTGVFKDGKEVYSLQEAWIDYDRNKTNFIAQLGFDMYDLLGKTGGAAKQAEQPQTAPPKKKTIKRSEIPAKAKAAGYSASEYEAILVKNGVQIED